ncbi:MAG: LCP family protein [Actinomycetota bacterium]
MRRLLRREPDPFAPSRYADIVKSVRRRERRHMRHWWQWALLGFFLLIIVGTAFAYWRYNQFAGQIQDEGINVAEREGLEPFNALLVGSDNRGDLTPEEQLELGAAAVGGDRADTLILAHIDPEENHVTMVQFPRDLYVPIAGDGTTKINAALAGGPDQLIGTVEQLTGLQIHQYVQVNIAGFRDLVNAIGGVSVCVPEAIPFDPKTGLEITEDEIGIVHFDGDRALRFVRSRNFTTGDFERIQNQQKFVAAAINKITSSDTLLNPTRIPRLMDVAGKNLRVDANTTPLGLVDLAKDLQDFDPDRYEAYIAPNLGITAIDGASVILPDMETMEVLFAAISRNESPADASEVPNIEPSTIRVGVYNGTGEDGLAAAAAKELQDATDIGDGPVNIEEIADARRQNFEETVVVYQPEAEKMARLVAAAIPGAELRRGKTQSYIDVAVIVGERFKTEKIVDILPVPLPQGDDVPEVCRRDAA